MTNRELRLRQRIDTLTTERRRLTATLQARTENTTNQRPRPTLKPVEPRPNACVYCGHTPAAGWPNTCGSHRDLPALDPHFSNGNEPVRDQKHAETRRKEAA